MPVGQYQIFDEEALIARVDFAYPELKIAIELDGYKYHHGKARWQRDLARRSALARLGWRVMHFSYEDLLKRPNEVIAAIRDVLRPNLLF